jgi:tRNA pseudouridine55 synthase
LTVLTPSGAIYLLDKRRGISSRKAAGEVARSFGYRKYGHAGTLDPEAAGVLVVLLGRATRLSRFLSGQEKRYDFVIKLGVTTDTDDDTGKVIGECDARHVSVREIALLLDSEFTGRIVQRVPKFSAVRVNGRRAFRAAREGDDTVEMPERAVTTGDWTLGGLSDCCIDLSVTVSAGTYVRALARDIGERLGTGGIALDIRRTRSGGFDLEECSEDPGCHEALLDMKSAMRGYGIVEVDREGRANVLHGRPVESDAIGIICLVDEESRLVAVGTGENGLVRPVCVLEKVE